MGNKKRAIFLLSLFVVYVLFQTYAFVEFFPFTAFQEDSYPADTAIKYVKVEAVEENGNKKILGPEVFPFLRGKRLPFFIKKAIRDPQHAEDLGNAYARASLSIREINFEQWKWDFVHDPHDKSYGFKWASAKVVTEPRDV